MGQLRDAVQKHSEFDRQLHSGTDIIGFTPHAGKGITMAETMCFLITYLNCSLINFQNAMVFNIYP